MKDSSKLKREMLTRPTEDETRKKKTIKYVCNSENDI